MPEEGLDGRSVANDSLERSDRPGKGAGEGGRRQKGWLEDLSGSGRWPEGLNSDGGWL